MIIALTRVIKLIRPEARAVFPYSNSLYIDDEVQTFIDAGSGGRAYAEIPTDKIELLLLSHNHFDHVNGISFFSRARIMAGREEALTYQNQELYLEFSGFYDWERLMGQMDRGLLSGTMSLPEDVPAQRGFQEVQLDGLIKDGDVFELGATSLRAIHLPGHSPGHYAFYCEKEGILFSADLDLAPDGPWYGGGLSDFDELEKSIKKLIEINPRILVTSHRRVFDAAQDNIPALLQAYLDVPLKKEEQSLIYLAEPRTIEDIARQEFIEGFKGKTPFAVFFTKMMIDKHLKRLEKAGKVKKIDETHYIRIG
ncbi:MBL fold metallo-hydrolase [Syntrophomonas wolfei]|jgi:ribonuclease/clavin/mitogillin|uniref:Metallo-beta-lactamase domain-containing protein n=1 Tax=Syntrophomonas wolfei subsp. wolfei (strain DSM 2245B / Goettingen) TaxID=335541 RepID=Q0AY27_SYNWW|nr:MBL fold metallo-hydrolase [Syntrophomonas wolfei]ABI68377.1 conserved hypothetical protein [Syntrophomonas wolfei subsp. wolfei str. Goettingen G311]